MAIAFVNKSDSTSTANNLVLVTKPVGTLDGHIMISWLYVEDATAGALPGLTAPDAGWNLLHDGYVNTAGKEFHAILYWKRAASEPADYTWSWTNGVWRFCTISTYSGCKASGSPIDASATGSIATGTTVVTPTVTAVGTDDMWLSGCYHWVGGTASQPGTWTERSDTGDVLQDAELLLSAAGPTGTATWTALPATNSDIAISTLLISTTTVPVVVDGTLGRLITTGVSSMTGIKSIRVY